MELIVDSIMQPVRLASFQVIGLFGDFDHRIDLNEEGRITALIGPNGIGKTVCLRLINALFRRNWSLFVATDFQRIHVRFSNSVTIDITKSTQEDRAEEVGEFFGVTFNTISPEGWHEKWFPKIVDQVPAQAGRIEPYVPILTRSGPKTWIHDVTRQVYTLQEVIENFGDQLPTAIIEAISPKPSPKLAQIIQQVDCHLIETQRLLVLHSDETRRYPPVAPSTLAISKKSQSLKSIISRELASYASISQSLDRSFPKRVVAQTATPSTENLADNLKELAVLRDELTDVGILDTEADDALPTPQEFTPAIASLLNVYVKDTRQKLGVLETLKSRIKLFKALVDDRFNPKFVVVDKNGFSVKRSNDTDVPLEKLSSGEQHQLVLFFELLFELKPNALILIDEPELSLHVAWQKKFIADLEKIIELNTFDVVLATHSPQLIGEWDEFVVDLGDVE